MRSGSIWVTDVFIKSSHRRKVRKNTLLLFDSDQWAFKVVQPAIISNGMLDSSLCVCTCVYCRESDSIICRCMNILWSELIRCSGSRELRGEFVLFQIICVINYTSLRLNNMKTTQLQLDGEGVCVCVKGCIYTPHIKKKPGPLFCPLCTAYSVKATLKLNLILRSSHFCYDIF